MFEKLVQVVILFFVIFDPLASFVVFFVATKDKTPAKRTSIALMSVGVAALISFAFLFFGSRLLELFNTDIQSFKVAGGIILGILGVKMALGQSLADLSDAEGDSDRAIAAVIATPLLTGPAAISAIIIASSEYGAITTGTAVTVVLVFTAILFYQAARINKMVGQTAIQVLSTILGLITLAWGVQFVRDGLGF